ncbi:MAG: hypothetical protein HN356_00145 [Calditrichaeota bacterium]|nr:hypothetical protein [Calditrichota bacterium]
MLFRKTDTRTKSLFLFALAILLLFGCEGSNPIDPADIIDVGIFNGSGTWAESVTALTHAVENAGFDVEVFDDVVFFTGNLNKYRMIIWPGGDPREYSVNLGSIGLTRIRNYVEFGHGFFGVGGGAAIADSDSGHWAGAGLFRGDAVWPVDRIRPYPDEVLTDIILSDRGHEISRNSANQYVSLYRWGPEFNIFHSGGISVVYRYVITGNPAIIAFPFGAGRVVLSGCQLEIEENNERDGTGYSIEPGDPDSEWELIEKILFYCLNNI